MLITPELVHPLDKGECPPLPGADVFEPGDLEFYLLGRLESRRPYDFRSPVRPTWRATPATGTASRCSSSGRRAIRTASRECHRLRVGSRVDAASRRSHADGMQTPLLLRGAWERGKGSSLFMRNETSWSRASSRTDPDSPAWPRAACCCRACCRWPGPNRRPAPRRAATGLSGRLAVGRPSGTTSATRARPSRPAPSRRRPGPPSTPGTA